MRVIKKRKKKGQTNTACCRSKKNPPKPSLALWNLPQWNAYAFNLHPDFLNQLINLILRHWNNENQNMKQFNHDPSLPHLPSIQHLKQKKSTQKKAKTSTKRNRQKNDPPIPLRLTIQILKTSFRRHTPLSQNRSHEDRDDSCESIEIYGDEFDCDCFRRYTA